MKLINFAMNLTEFHFDLNGNLNPDLSESNHIEESSIRLSGPDYVPLPYFYKKPGVQSSDRVIPLGNIGAKL